MGLGGSWGVDADECLLIREGFEKRSWKGWGWRRVWLGTRESRRSILEVDESKAGSLAAVVVSQAKQRSSLLLLLLQRETSSLRLLLRSKKVTFLPPLKEDFHPRPANPTLLLLLLLLEPKPSFHA